jgi:sigma-B regulation protein RsbU (phosphoserine phosphatase)
MVIRPGGLIVWLESGGAPVGMFPDWIYEESAVQLRPGDVVVGCTDGVIEALNPAGEDWGLEGVRRAAAESGATCADDLVRVIFRSMDEFSRGYQTDDATVVVLRIP